VPPKFTS